MVKLCIFESIAIVLMTILLIVEAKSSDLSTERIFGGQRARPGQFPHQASIRGPVGSRHFCGGVLISDRFVLTTANCTQGRFSQPQNVRVVLGTHLIFPLHVGTSVLVDRITNHPQFNRNTMANDISVIRIARSVPTTNLIRPARLPSSNIQDNRGVTVSGWGPFNVRIKIFLINFKIICILINFFFFF